MCLVVFCDLNNFDLNVDFADAVETVITVAAGQMPEKELAQWIRDRARQRSE